MSSDQQWGPCDTCKWWQIEPDATVEKLTAGWCIEESLQRFQLRITGNGGCNQYSPGKPARGQGASKQPPEGKPAR